ncbi:Asp/Glu racemase [Grimontia sp. S25]|uniref:Asp/Glu racemase n=1 Tax=Grimontia sedimenti TaxID=2711294 RepID=A0A6M1RQN3_9GAMM|nr:Asp/Glu racemase [Grimontia sedimenti]NGO00239.1 Asp/Glu racemase [Grimontia sedimenti]
MKAVALSPQYSLSHLAPDGRVGVIALATDFNIEYELATLLPEDIRAFTSRVKNINPLTIENLKTMAPDITRAADCILPGTDLDVIIYACTSGTIAIGDHQIRELIHLARPDALVTNPVSASLAAFNSLGAKNISILTPYTEAVNRELAAFFETQGLEVINIAGFDFEDDTAMTFISPEDIAQAAITICDPEADALFISCTALRAAEVVSRIETVIEKPVVTSNLALIWHTMTLLNDNTPIKGYGVLLETPYSISNSN